MPQLSTTAIGAAQDSPVVLLNISYFKDWNIQRRGYEAKASARYHRELVQIIHTR